MKRITAVYSVITASLLMISLTCLAQKAEKAPGRSLERPKLVVGIVVDQMRWDYLYRYYDRYSESGFKRMLNEGFSVENTYINYVPTVTGIGHASIYTGSVPAVHGIAGNNFIIEKTGKTVYCVSDSTVTSIGSNNPAGLMSPHNLLSTTITDELKLATNFRAKVIGVALKDRASILPSGHAADAAYWFDTKDGKWISSSWYMKTLPEWVNRINQQQPLAAYIQKGWNTLFPIKTYDQSTEDNSRYEGRFKGTESPVFPVNTVKLVRDNGIGSMLSTPFGNSITLEMAEAAIRNENLGKDNITDFLTISCSSTDFIGHQFGPNSIEIEDTYLRLDKELGNFLSFLDSSIGRENYTVFLTADHGAAHNVEFMKDHKLNAGGWEINTVLKALNQHLKSLFNSDSLTLSLLYYQVHFNNKLITEKGLDSEKIKAAAIKFLKDQDGVAYVADMEKVQSTSIPAVLRERIINGFHHGRSGTVQIILEPAWYYSYGKPLTGTDHSSWNPNDSHIPLVFMGWGINRGKTNRTAHMTDIAPTIAALLRIQEPNGNIGSPITEALK